MRANKYGKLVGKLYIALKAGQLESADCLLKEAEGLLEDEGIKSNLIFILLKFDWKNEKKLYADFLSKFLKIDREKNTAEKLKNAIIHGDMKMIDYLLQDITIPEIQNLREKTDQPLAYYCMSRLNVDVRDEMLKQLIFKGLDTSVRDKYNNNLLLTFLKFFGEKNDSDLLNIAKTLTESGKVSKTEPDSLYCTPLNISILNLKNKKLVEFFMVKEILDMQNISGRSPLQSAAMVGELGIVEMLLNEGVQVNLEDKDGRTALYWAKKCNYDKIVKALINKGAMESNFIVKHVSIDLIKPFYIL